MLKILSHVERIKLSNPKGMKEDEVRSLLQLKRFKNPLRIEGDASITLYSEKGRFSRLGAYIIIYKNLTPKTK
jgi:cytochrome c biogenesis protein ResB